MTAPSRISFDPNPGTPGQKTRICYDFSAIEGVTATGPVTIGLTPDPPGSCHPTTVTLYDVDGQRCADITTTAQIVDIIAEDDSGQSADGSCQF